MKRLNVRWINMLLALLMFGLISACNEVQEKTADEVAEEPGMGEMEMQEEGAVAAPVNMENEPAFLVDYIEVKNALFEDSFEQAKEAAAELQRSLAENKKLSQEQLSELQTAAERLEKAGDIQAQRRIFAELSADLYQVVQNKELTDQELYWQHCPMALGGEGANWISYENQIQNPFMGQRMPRCGSVAETIN